MWLLGSAIIRSKIFWLVLAASAVGAYVFHLGNQHGSYARAYRAIVAELAIKNAELKALASMDTQETETEDQARDAAHAAAVKVVGTSPKVTKDQAKLLNAIGE